MDVMQYIRGNVGWLLGLLVQLASDHWNRVHEKSMILPSIFALVINFIILISIKKSSVSLPGWLVAVFISDVANMVFNTILSGERVFTLLNDAIFLTDMFHLARALGGNAV